MNFSGISLSPPRAGASFTPTRTTRSKSTDLTEESPKLALAGGSSTLEASPNPNAMTATTLDSLDLGFTTPTKASAASSGLSPISKSTSKKRAAPKFPSLSLGNGHEDDFTRNRKSPKTPKTAENGSPRKRVNLSGSVSILSFNRERNMSPRKTPSPRKLQLVDDASFMSVHGSTPKPTCDLSPMKSSPLKSSLRPSKTPSPKKVSFADDPSFALACASTPKSCGFSPKSTPAKPEVSELSVMSTTSTAASQESNELSPASNASTNETEDGQSAPETPSKTNDEVESRESNSPSEASETSAISPSPSKASETSAMFQSPSKADISMHDVTWMSDYATSTPFQTFTFTTTDLTEAAQMLTGPFQPELFEDADYSSALSRPWSFPMSQIAQKHARAVSRKKVQRRKRQEVRKLRVEKAIREQVAASLEVDELEAAPQFRVIASRGQLTYAICSRKRQRVTEELEDADAYWEEGEDDGIAQLIEARRVVRNNLFHVPIGTTVQEMRRQYHANMKKFGEPPHLSFGKRNYDGKPKRAYNNDLFTHSIMQQLLTFPMPELSFEFVLSHAIAESDKAQGRRSQRTRNVRQHIAIYGEPEVSVIEEEEEPQSPTRKLPHFPSTATHQSSSSRKIRLDEGADNLRAKLASLASIPEPASPVAEPHSSPIGPGFTFECPSFISSPGVTKNSDQDDIEATEDAKENEHEQEQIEETVASPVVVFKDRTPRAMTPQNAFKKRRSLPATVRRLSFSTPLRRASLPAAGSDQPSSVQDLNDQASEALVVAPTSVVELPAVQNPLEVDSASHADSQTSPVELPVVQNPAVVDSASPAPASQGSQAGSSSPPSVVVDVRENPDIFGSSQDRTGSPVQALASLTRVFEEAQEEDRKVAVERHDGRMIVRFKVSDEHADVLTPEKSVAAASSVHDVETTVEPALPASPSPTPAPVMVALEQNTQETKLDDEKVEEQMEDEDEEVIQVPIVAVTGTEEPEDDSELALLRSFVSRHAASRAARAAEATAITLEPATATASALPTAPIRLAATPERRSHGIWADTPAFSVSSAERPRASPAVSSARQPLGVLDANSPSPKKVKRKADEVEGREASPEKPPVKRCRKNKATKPEKDPGQPREDKSEAEKENEKDESEKPLEADPDPDAPVPGVRTRAQRAAARGEAPPTTKIPLRHQVYTKVRNPDRDLVTLTRKNTAANKGDAVKVGAMLEQLKDTPPAIETRAAAAARKDGKSVQWAEELARSQSEEPPVLSPSPELSPAEVKEVGKATRKKVAGTPRKATTQTKAANTTATNSTTASKAPAKATTAKAPAKASAKAPAKTTKAAAAAAPSKLRQPSTSAAAAGPRTEGAKVAKPKVTAAAKKAVGMTANGTPAKRSRRIAEKK